TQRRGVGADGGCRNGAELAGPALVRAYVAGQLGQLRLFRAPRRRLPLQSLERRDLLLQARHRGELRGEQAELLPGGERVRELLVEPLELLARRHDGLLRHAPLPVERQGTLAPRR